MRFDREEFIDETAGSLGPALDCIEALLDVLCQYTKEDEVAEGHGYGCYGKRAREVVKENLKARNVGQYIK